MAFNLQLTESNHETKTINPLKVDIENAIKILKQNENNFFILDSDTPINSFIFIQGYYIENNIFHVEVQYEEDNALFMYGNDNLSEEALLQLLLNFVSNITPNLDDWDYLGDWGNYNYYSEYRLRKLLKNKSLLALKSKNVPQDKICLETSDIQVLLHYVEKNNINTIFYCYKCANEDLYKINNIDGDLSKLANDEIKSYRDIINATDFDKPALLELFCNHSGMIVSIQIVAPWIKELTTANNYVIQLEKKYENELDLIKINRSKNRDATLEQLKNILLNNADFSLCTNQKLRYEFIRKFLINKENEIYRQSFLGDTGYIDSQAIQNFVDMVFAIYKQTKNKK